MERRQLLAAAPALFVTTDTALVSISAEGSRSTLASSIAGNRGVEVVGSTIYAAGPVNTSIPLSSPSEIRGYSMAGQQVSSTPVPSSVTWFVRFTALSDGRFALLDNVNDKVHFIDASGTLLHSSDLLPAADTSMQNLDAVQVRDRLVISEDGEMRVLAVDLNTYAVSTFRSMPSVGEWLSGIAYSSGQYYTGTRTAVLRFTDTGGPLQVGSVPTDNITSIAVSGAFAYVTVNGASAVYQVDTASGEAQTLYAGLNYAQDVELAVVEVAAAGPLVINGTAGNDEISMQVSGSDLLVTINGSQTPYALDSIATVTVNALEGDDTVTVVGSIPVTIDGGIGNDSLVGGDDADELRGGDGHDTIFGGGGNDIVFANGGNDMVAGGDGNDELHGGLGDDKLYGNDGTDLIFAGQGNDLVAGQGKADTINGADGSDTIDGGAGNDLLYGQGKADTIYGFDGSDTIDGGAGNDSLLGQGKADSINGSFGDDTIIGGAGSDSLYGGDGNDLLDVQDEALFFADLADGEANDDFAIFNDNDTVLSCQSLLA